MFKLALFRASIKSVETSLALLNTIKIASKTSAFGYCCLTVFKKPWVCASHTKLALRTGSAALVVGAHQHSNWIPNKLSAKSKNISLITIPYNARLPRLLQFNVVCNKSQTPKTIPEGNAVRSETKLIACCLNTNWAQRRTPCYTTCLYRYSNRRGIIVRTTNWLKQVNALACLQSARKPATLFPRLLTPFL
ncbi:MAG: hypothetical protein HCTETUND2_136 [Candidatus Hodgkinia cicadicola]|nr:MAG: hypothetical protein HCTETUND2_136 [Candidatus Hodgkinia cicadicola]